VYARVCLPVVAAAGAVAVDGVALRRRFRVVAADVFLRVFSSDRSHMRAPADGSWLAPPPPYPPIRAPGQPPTNLASFLDVSVPGDGDGDQPQSSSSVLGTVFARQVDFLRRFGVF
jgi:hypothetical protein